MKPLEMNQNPSKNSAPQSSTNPQDLLDNPIGVLVQTLEQSATKIVDRMEGKAMEAFALVEERVGDLERKAVDMVGTLEDKAVDAIKNIDEVPQMIENSIRSNLLVAVGIGFGLGALVRIAQSKVPPETLRGWAKQGGQYAAKTAATLAVRALTKA